MKHFNTKRQQRIVAVMGIISVIVAPVAKAASDDANSPKHIESFGYYHLTDWERSLVERTVYGEAGNQTFAGQMAVAQCILDACEKENASPVVVLKQYGYTNPVKDYSSVSDSVKSAVDAVFVDGYRVTEEDILWFYNPSMCSSAFHESQNFVVELGDHRFFSEVEK